MELLTNTKIDFISRRKAAFVVSGALVLLGTVAMVQIWRGAANLGNDFAGGTSVQVRFRDPVELGEVRTALSRGGLTESDLQQFVGGRRVLVRLKAKGESAAGTARGVEEGLRTAFPQNPLELESSNEVGPVIGRELQKAALWAILISLVGIVAYIAWRFEFRFGIAAAVATFHDVLAVLGALYLLDLEITLLVVTALLTLAGYSLTDTVVIYDRIRENLRARRRETLAQTINASINQVLARTLMTSLTTLLAVLALLLVGGEVLRDFAFSLFLGIIVGSYSSWFVASPIVYEWRLAADRRRRRPARA
ncbi:MAG: protein translocase subunit SecF [candidate division NC10 bacterium]|nr:protein translocase subunit SecF [candidate division NC10 bacterium]